MIDTEDLLFCETCAKALKHGDLGCWDAELCFFCEACAPTWADTLAEWREIADDQDRLDKMGMTADDAAARIAAVESMIAELGGDAKNVRPL